jgi:hypothetical protein
VGELPGSPPKKTVKEPPAPPPRPRAPDLPPVERLEVVRLEKGDVLVATIPAECDAKEADEVRCHLADLFGQDANLLVITGDITLAGYRPIRERT